ncbi:sigma-54-dependent transcriptional regulator [Haliangium ochraceum]|uniref:Two component, sigma54 specific, transcriptional regulator, Fis family n=1 Tax=Haliangium ochraceum (strain DSM 14365 / JCM 11303 / SMP-2) TaxID=502025 RepID=D0LHR5_HALO1|nr:sigma-54 dependent transcriptional regulator [Haliangium ochraceum]ACY12927.1 two component, sigma54 specific, transcriptional regulator, Fis family [Haliangium ochraceum DSM 14365]
MHPAQRVLVVDAEPQIHRLIALLLGDGYQVDGAASAAEAIARVHHTPYDAVLIDTDLPTMSGFDLLRKLRKLAPELAVILTTAQATVQAAVKAIRIGALDYLRKTVSADELRAAVQRAADHATLAREVRRLRSEVDRARGLDHLIGDSPAMRQLVGLVERVAHSDATVLILGESGTGKELLSRTLHRIGPRADRPFVAFDCSALTPSLLEAELFGHEKGAFTGAGKARRGLFREAHQGTIFLDEIGDIAPSVQNKLLRVLQEREIKPVGGDQFVQVDVRVIAATNKDLKAQVARGAFREDLYWRLAVVPIQVPPLRERREDIALLAAHILERKRGAAKSFAGGETPYPTKISPGAMTRLLAYHWPGNIRELENVLSRAAILCDGEEIRADDLDMVGVPGDQATPPDSAGATEDDAPGPAKLGGLDVDASAGRPLKRLIDETVKAVERQAIAEALERCEGSPSKAARRLGISRASVYNKIKEYGLQTGS